MSSRAVAIQLVQGQRTTAVERMKAAGMALDLASIMEASGLDEVELGGEMFNRQQLIEFAESICPGCSQPA